jgi:hypothetical protein
MDEMDAAPRPQDERSTYEPPAVESRSSARDPLVWIAPTSPVVC